MKTIFVSLVRCLIASHFLLVFFSLNVSGEEIMIVSGSSSKDEGNTNLHSTQIKETFATNSDSSRLSVYNNIAITLNNIASNSQTAVSQKENTQPVLDIYQQIISVLGSIAGNIESTKAINTTNQQAIPVSQPLNLYASKNGAIARGKKVFHEMQCISCHGINGKGHEAKTNMKDERGLPIMAADLTQPSSFGNGNARKDIFRTVMTGLDGSPMPSFVDLFVGEEDRAWDLVEYVYSLQEDALARFLP